MKKLLAIVVLGLLFSGCDRVSDDLKAYCASENDVLNAKTDQAAKYAYEACVATTKLKK
jgi:hypothetical protein